jgi:hypothetical protein
MARSIFESQTDEGAKGSRVLEMELQLPVAQAVDLLEQCDPEHLIAVQPRAPSIASASPQQLPVDERPDPFLLPWPSALGPPAR